MSSIALRLFGGLAGLLVGGFLGVVSLILVILVSGWTFGLDNVLPGVVIGAGIGLVLGFWLPIAALKAILAILLNW